MVTLRKKLQQIESWNGLQATYHNGDYTVSVWYHEADLDSSAGLYFCDPLRVNLSQGVPLRD